MQIGGDTAQSKDVTGSNTDQLFLTATSSAAQHASPDRPNLAEYSISVHTSELPGGGTNCSAYIVVHGRQGNTGRQGLQAAGGDFGRGSTEKCLVQGQNVGQMLYICIGHNDDGKVML